MNTIGGFSGVAPLRGPALGQRPAPAQPALAAASANPPLRRRVMLDGDGKEFNLPGPGQRLSLGRDPQSDVCCQDNLVSRRHAELVEKDGNFWLRDLGSTNGTYLNGEAVEAGKWVPYKLGDQLQLGESKLAQVELESLPALQMPKSGQALHIGRAPENGLQLSWPTASRSHAVIQEKDGRHWLFDAGSSNGTFVDGKRIPSQQWVTVQSGQQIEFAAGTGAFSLQAAPASAPTSSLEPLSPQQSQAILGRAQLSPNPIGIRALGAADCSQEFLQTQGLGPQVTFQMGNDKIHLSQPYALGDNRVGCVGYVEGKDGQVHIRSFYRSNSQGLWRAASHAGFNGWIGKGQGESSTNLPIALQKHLQQRAEGDVKPMSSAHANQAFYGALAFGDQDPPKELSQQLRGERSVGAFDAQVPGQKYGKPESFRFSQRDDAPNFAKTEDSYHFQHPLHGPLQACSFSSHNGQYQYLFMNDQQGRSWLAQIDAQSELTDWGTRSTPIHHGDLAMPAIEYASQIPAGYQGAPTSGHYADASAYVHRLPVVADFRRSQGLA